MYYVELRGDIEIIPKGFVKKSSAIKHATKLVRRFIGGEKYVQIIVTNENISERIITIGY